MKQHIKSTIQIQDKKWVEINDDSHGVYHTNSQIKFKMSVLNQGYVIILVSGTMSVTNTVAQCK